MAPILAALVLVAPAFAGCLGTASAATAQEHEATADERAEAWDSQAQLAQAVGLEGEAAQWMRSWGFTYDYEYEYDGDYGGQDWGQDGGSPSAPSSGPQSHSSHRDSPGSSPWAKAAEDEDMGDGHCKVWAYTYVSPNKPGEVFRVILDEDGELLANGTEARDDEEALSDWEVDSDEAAEIAAEANDGIREGQDAEHQGFVLVLEENEGHSNPTWTVVGGGGDASGGGGGVVILDAVTGEVLESHGGAGSR